VWFALDGNDPESRAMEQVLARLEAVVRFADELTRRFGDEGLGSSFGEVLGFSRRLKTTLDDVPAAELALVMEDTRRLLGGLTALARTLEDLKRLRVLLGP
jgi:hypothetical protein